VTKLNTNIYDLLLDYDLHIASYEYIKKKSGSLTPGFTPETVDPISRRTMQKTIESLKDHSFQFKPARIENITKANGKMRAFGISSPKDKIVQQVMVMILEAIYIYDNASVSVKSHGFIPKKGVHTALKNISTWKAIDWFIEGNTKSYFDTIDHKKLEFLLRKRIEDQQFIDLYWKAVKAGYVEVKENIISILGTSQGSVLSPILGNIYLHELDSFIGNFCKESQLSEASTLPSTKSLKLNSASKIHTINRKKIKGLNLTTDKQMELKKRIVERGYIPSSINDSRVKINYVRYADEFLIGITGSLRMTKQLQSQINEYITKELMLTRSLEKTKIIGAKVEKVLFLGTHIYRPKSITYVQKVKTKIRSEHILSGRIPVSRLALIIPIKIVIAKLENQGFVKIINYKLGQIKPKAKTS
jgi:retron-type reverse transcriptase